MPSSNPRLWNGATFNSTPFNAPGVWSIVVPATSMFAALRRYLMSLPELADLTDIYKNEPKRGWVEPFAIYSPITSTDEINNTTAFITNKHFQFSIVSSNDYLAETMGDAAYRALLPVDLTRFPRLSFEGGYEIVRWPIYKGRLIKQTMRSANNLNMWIYTFAYNIQTGHEA